MNTKISDSNKIELKKLWNNGKTLEESFIYYVSNDISENYKKNKRDLDDWNESSVEEKAEKIDNIHELTSGLKAKELNSNFDKEKEIAAKYILNKLISAQLVAIGFLGQMDLDKTPEIIPAHIWPIDTADIDWEASKFSNGEFEFFNIRLIKVTTTKNKKIKSLPSNKRPSKKPRGRPSPHGKKIEDTYFVLKESGDIDLNASLQWNIDLIRKTIWENYPDLNGSDDGLDDETIRRRIVYDFNKTKTLS